MADRGILFSAPMVRALLDGRKTQTRRLLKGAPGAYRTNFLGFRFGEALFCEGNHPKGDDCEAHSVAVKLPYAVGDRLWVRETACWVSAWGWRYLADNDDLTEKRESGEVGKWRAAIHMPRTASRLTLTVRDVRVQRLNQISEDDALAEGVGRLTVSTPKVGKSVTAVEGYAALWDDLHGPGAWAANPWVVAVTFDVRKGNIDG